MILYVALQETPPRPRNSYLPDSIRQVRIRYNGFTPPGNAPLPKPYLLVRSAAEIHRMVAAINSLTDINTGFSCVAAGGEGAWLDFVRPTGTFIRVHVYPACFSVKVGHTRAEIRDGPSGRLSGKPGRPGSRSLQMERRAGLQSGRLVQCSFLPHRSVPGGQPTFEGRKNVRGCLRTEVLPYVALPCVRYSPRSPRARSRCRRDR